MLSHETAAELHRLTDKATDMIHVTIPGQRRVRAVEGVSLHRSGRAVEAVQGNANPPRTTVEETVLDLTQAAASFDDVCGWVTRAFARELTDEDRLRAAMTGRPRLRWRADLHELIVAAADGDHSVLEFRYHRDVERAHGLPEPSRQVPFATPAGRRGRRDRVYEEYGVVVELDGRLAHPAENQWKDKARDNAAAAEGKQSLRYGWMHVQVEGLRDRRGGGQGAPPAWLGRPPQTVLARLPRSARTGPASHGGEHPGGVGQVGQDHVRAGQVRRGVTAGRDGHHAGPGGQRGLDVQRRVTDQDGG